MPVFNYPNTSRTPPIQQQLAPSGGAPLYAQYSTSTVSSSQYTPNSPQVIDKRKTPFFPFPYHSRSQSESLTSLDSADWSGIQDRKRMRRVYDVTDQELLELARKSIEISLDELALPVTMAEKRVDEVSQNSSKHSREIRIAESDKKKQHQIFAMVVLMRSVEADENAVCPRNRIFGKYVSLCKENGVSPLCNASFGKLVKLVFPNLTTRRLGTRGYSRYHYCGIKLIDDHDYEDDLESESPVTMASHTPTSSITSQTTHMSTQPSRPEDNFLASSLDSQFYPLLKDQSIEFVPPSIEAFIHLYPTELQRTAKTVSIVYSGSCKDTFYCVRYMKIRSLLEGLSNFKFNESEEVSKILSQPQIVPWITECDSKMYKAIIKLMTKIAFQNVPETVMYSMTNFVNGLVDTINEMQIPEHIRQAKIKAAKNFIQVCNRLVKLTSLSSGLAQKKSEPLIRSRMMEGWLKVDLRKVVDRDLIVPEDVLVLTQLSN
ncbi:unnamed protein product [Ambrosiozyma monospora]|uniref:Unnamed protein product n=1 Tax=Ambrosiozyma monospora TaxID=43982 RepID=A0ACB5TFC9_AMBMO|nr:unnamed protein product [Ambrosiozyma monospora]